MSSANYLNTVFNINLIHEGEDISEDYLLYAPISKYSSTLIDQTEAHVIEFIKRHGFTTSKDKVRTTGSNYTSVPCPNHLSLEYYAIHAKLAATHLFMDDIFDLTPELINSQNIGMVERMNRFLSQYFRCHAEPIHEDIRETYPKFENVCQMFLELGENLIATGKDLSWVYEGFDIMIDGHIPQVTLPPPESAEEYLERKKYNIGITNDNYTVILIQQGFNVKEAIRRTILRYNQFFIKSLMLISEMDKMNISETDRKYLRVYLTTLRAVLEWASHVPMYNPNKNIKYCEVQDRNRATKCVAEALCAIESI